MKLKNLFPVVGVVAIAAMLSSCGTSNQFASSFGKRRYMKGYYFNGSSKEKAVASAKTNAPISNQTSVTKTTVAANATTSNTAVKAQAQNSNQVNTFVPVVKSNNVAASALKVDSKVVNSNIDAKAANAAVQTTKTDKVSKLENTANTEYGGGGGGCKSWIACVLLCFFLGGLGIHRFYMGYTWQGVVQLLTGGGCGIWALIDFIRILMKTLKPKNGSYCD